MARQSLEPVWLQVRYRGNGPLVWNGGAQQFGVQDRDNLLTLGAPDEDGALVFNIRLDVKPPGRGAPVFVGRFAHGTADGRFLYLSWRNTEGNYAARLKLPLSTIAWSDIQAARAAGRPLVTEIIDDQPRVTRTGVNIGGTRKVVWRVQ